MLQETDALLFCIILDDKIFPKLFSPEGKKSSFKDWSYCIQEQSGKYYSWA